jgi:hypothetical protein
MTSPTRGSQAEADVSVPLAGVVDSIKHGQEIAFLEDDSQPLVLRLHEEVVIKVALDLPLVTVDGPEPHDVDTDLVLGEPQDCVHRVIRYVHGLSDDLDLETRASVATNEIGQLRQHRKSVLAIENSQLDVLDALPLSGHPSTSLLMCVMVVEPDLCYKHGCLPPQLHEEISEDCVNDTIISIVLQ